MLRVVSGDVGIDHCAYPEDYAHALRQGAQGHYPADWKECRGLLLNEFSQAGRGFSQMRQPRIFQMSLFLHCAKESGEGLFQSQMHSDVGGADLPGLLKDLLFLS